MIRPTSGRRAGKTYLWWALWTVPAILLMGLLSGKISNAGYGDPWFDLLIKPAIMPPAWVFPVAWTILYIVTGLAFALILDARRARGRTAAIALFLIQLGLNLAWSPVFFALHRIMLAFGILLAMLLWAGLASLVFWNIRRSAGLMMIPYLVWLLFAAVLNWQIHSLNPNGVTLVPGGEGTQIIVQ